MHGIGVGLLCGFASWHTSKFVEESRGRSSWKECRMHGRMRQGKPGHSGVVRGRCSINGKASRGSERRIEADCRVSANSKHSCKVTWRDQQLVTNLNVLCF